MTIIEGIILVAVVGILMLLSFRLGAKQTINPVKIIEERKEEKAESFREAREKEKVREQIIKTQKMLENINNYKGDGQDQQKL
jgi:hypothetical protein